MISRRKFIGGTGVALGAAALGLVSWEKLAGVKSRLYAGHFDDQGRFLLSITDPEAGARSVIPLPMYPHGIVQHPRLTHRVFCFEKSGRTACEVDWREKQVRTVASEPRREFYGHGFFSADGRNIFSTEADPESGRGSIVVRDSVNHQVLGELDSHGVGPHDCRVLDGGKVVVIANTGDYIPSAQRNKPDLNSLIVEPSSLCWIELDSGKLLERREIPTPGAAAGHLDVAGDYTVAITSDLSNGGPGKILRKGPCVFVSRGGGPLQAGTPAEKSDRDFVGELLSVAVHPNSLIACVTNPGGQQVSFWDIRNNRLLRVSALASTPMGAAVSRDRRHFLVSTLTGEIHRFHADSLEIIPQASLPGGNGSHLYQFTS